jgi:hypothetical protein
MLRGQCALLTSAISAIALLLTPIAQADSGRLLATGGASEIEGSAGGGIVPWAVLSSYATDGEVGASVYRTHIEVRDYALDSEGIAFTANNRVELSLAREDFHLGTLGAALGMPGAAIREDIFAAKLRLAGDVIYTDLPQISIGAQYKRNLDFALPAAVGARSDHGVDVYMAATKVFLAGALGYNLLLNATLRSTNANQLGLLGFGGDRGNRSLQAEVSAALLFTPAFALGVEYRQKPDHLSFAREDHFSDLFAAWFLNKHLSLVGAYTDLGSIATLRHQRGWYLSAQVAL